MHTTAIVRETPIRRSARVMQLEGLYDVPASKQARVEWRASLPLDERPWQIGLIVGPSGAGKTTLARERFGEAVVRDFDWPDDAAIVDAFPAALGIKDVVGLLSAVGFSTVPAWLRPFRVLSTGEQFRATVARALAEMPGLVVMDEFTSVVDRQVAQVVSHTVQKAVRRAQRQFVAVTCHYDVLEWLQPDWVYQPHANAFQWRSLQRHPAVELVIYPVRRAVWPLFRPHHYLSGGLHVAAQCFGGFVDGDCVAFTSYVHFPHARTRNIKMGHRLVVLPDWQGLGIGGRLDDWLGQYLHERGYRYRNVVAHPAMIAYYSRSPRWRLMATGRAAPSHSRLTGMARHTQQFTVRRIASSFEYAAPSRSA